MPQKKMDGATQPLFSGGPAGGIYGDNEGFAVAAPFGAMQLHDHLVLCNSRRLAVDRLGWVPSKSLERFTYLRFFRTYILPDSGYQCQKWPLVVANTAGGQ